MTVAPLPTKSTGDARRSPTVTRFYHAAPRRPPRIGFSPGPFLVGSGGRWADLGRLLNGPGPKQGALPAAALECYHPRRSGDPPPEPRPEQTHSGEGQCESLPSPCSEY